MDLNKKKQTRTQQGGGWIRNIKKEEVYSNELVFAVLRSAVVRLSKDSNQLTFRKKTYFLLEMSMDCFQEMSCKLVKYKYVDLRKIAKWTISSSRSSF